MDRAGRTIAKSMYEAVATENSQWCPKEENKGTKMFRCPKGYNVRYLHYAMYLKVMYRPLSISPKLKCFECLSLFTKHTIVNNKHKLQN